VNPFYPAVARRAGHRCEYCRAPEAVFNFPFEVEHVVPVSHGGTDDADNLALACRSCNLWKANHLTGHDEETGADFPLFHPRRDRWAEHFHADPDTGSITGLTPTGRATVARLDMNHPNQFAARMVWVRLRLFP
jgi:hypothetical protein